MNNIGHDFRHHTFFEMLGNWSFNDYGKHEACEWALEFLINQLHLDSSKLTVTYFSGDRDEDIETKKIWQSLGIQQDKIIANKSGDNFWEMGDHGPCGMSTEIFYPTGPNQEQIELWNIVFIDRLKLPDSDKMVPLKNKFVDTGLGLERILSILDNLESNYDTDVFKSLFDVIQAKSNVEPYKGTLNDELDIKYRILADHCRMITIALADGIRPGRKGNAFDLRSIIKKSLLISRDTFKQETPRYLLFDLVDETVKILAQAYPELESTIKETRRILAFESKRYLKIIANAKAEADTHTETTVTKSMRNIKQLLEQKPDDKLYSISGRIENFRSYKTFHFVDLVDGSTREHIQLVVGRNDLQKPELGSYITCSGNLVQSQGSKQTIEFKVKNFSFIGSCDPLEYPLASKSDLPQDWCRQFIHLRPRARHFSSLLRVRSELELSLHMIMKQLDFFRVHTPSISSNDSEASSDLFSLARSKKLTNRSTVASDDDYSESVKTNGSDDDTEGYSSSEEGSTNDSSRVLRKDYFKKDVFLVTSAQLHLESLAASLSRVYTISTAFRAENSITRRHLCEFLMFEAEEANLSSLETLMDRVETIIKFVGQYLAHTSEHRADTDSLLEFYNSKSVFEKLVYTKYIRLKYGQAIEILRDKINMTSIDYGHDIGRLHELELLKYTNQVPIFITGYPKQLKPFYMKSDGIEAANFDLIAPYGGEICGGSLREDREAKLLDNLKASGLDNEQLKHLNWYLDTRRFGSFPHGGFGIGFERLLQSFFGIKNIKDTTAFPRWSGKCPM